MSERNDEPDPVMKAYQEYLQVDNYASHLSLGMLFKLPLVPFILLSKAFKVFLGRDGPNQGPRDGRGWN